jgi:hypothetical protein
VVAGVLALTGLGLIAPVAQAADDSPTDSSGQKQCGLSTQKGVRVFYPAGTKITITNPDTDSKETYVCNGKTGDWDEQKIVSGGMSVTRFYAGMLTTLSANSFTTTTGATGTLSAPTSPRRTLSR